MLFIQRFVGVSRAFPEVVGVLDSFSEVSCGELFSRAQRLAEVVGAQSSSVMIGVLMEKSVDYIVSILAIHLLGRTVVPLDSSYPVERLRKMITSIDLSLCLVNQQRSIELSRMLDEHTHLLSMEELGAMSVRTSGIKITSEALDESPAYVVFTSGTTGQPKPVMVPYLSLSTLIDWMVEVPGPSGTTLLYAAQGFDVSFQEIYSALCRGDRLLVITDRQKKDLHELTRQLASRAVTRLFLPTSMLIPFVTFNLHDAQALADLREVICAGEQLKITDAVRQWFKTHPQCRLINHYGPAETHVVMEHRLDSEPHGWPDLPPIGQVTLASKAYLLGDQLQPVEPGTVGQLYIAGRSLALGYYGMQMQTAERFVTHPQTHERIYNTGDICVLNEQGLFEYKGRRDRQYKVRGYRVELKEIEATAIDSGLLDDCLVVARQSGLTTSLIMYFTAQDSDQDISLSLHGYLVERLPDYMLPSFYKKIVAIPLTPNGKTDVDKLPQVGGLRSEVSSRYIAPQGELETTLCVLAASCFGLDRIGANDNFIEAGANSITLVTLVAELRYLLAHDFRQTDLFEYPTPRLLCRFYQRSISATGEIDPTIAPVSSWKLRAAVIHGFQGRKRG
ncbi:non-ribosomal peptide synthetase [Pseudomonas frederiksbergensis]|nr:non-ribosomal peptide synthetase [Pseudomonas frederiksbergensis]